MPPRRKADLTEEQVKRLFQAIKSSDKPTRERDYLILLLIYKYGLKGGEVGGSGADTRSTLPGIHIEDLVRNRNTILLRMGAKGDFGVRRIQIEPEDMKRLVQYAGERTTGKLFDADTLSIRYFFRQYAKVAKIRDAVVESLRRFYKPPEIERRHYHYLEEIEQDIRDTAIDMADYFVILTCIENTSRRFISTTLENKHGKDWWEKASIAGSVREYVKQRQKEELDTTFEIRSTDPLSYTTLGHLQLIISDNWTEFESKFRSEKAMSRVFGSLNYLRAVITHSSGLSDDDKMRFELAVKDWRRIQSGSSLT